MRLHLNKCHKIKADGMEARKLIVTNPKEILKHKKAMMKKNFTIKISKKPEFIPIDKDNFKPRKDSKICQYCDYRSNLKFNVDEHVNVCHEMNQWFQCNHCSHAALDKSSLRRHFLTVHNLNLTSRFINDLMIKDPTKIDHLKKEKIQKKKDKDDFSKMPPEQLRKDPKFMPIDHADLKPRDHPLICQYCGFSSKVKRSIDNHVNSKHELTTWFKCSECDFATLLPYCLKNHLKDQHLRRNANGDEAKKLTVKDQKEIDQLKKKWTEQIQAQNRANEEFTKLQGNQQIRKESKFIAINRADFKPRIYPRICQYCGFTTRREFKTKRHVNTCHEMTDWYRCECCDFASLDIDIVKRHLKLLHSKNVTRERLESCLIKDEEVIDRLRSRKIQHKKSREDSSILLPEQLSSEPNVCQEQEIPTDFSENEDCFRSESDDEPDVDVNEPIKLKALSNVLERLKTPITKDYSVSGNKKVQSWSTKDIKKEELSETDDRFMVAWATKDIKKEELIEIDDRFMLENEDSYE